MVFYEELCNNVIAFVNLIIIWQFTIRNSVMYEQYSIVTKYAVTSNHKQVW